MLEAREHWDRLLSLAEELEAFDPSAREARLAGLEPRLASQLRRMLAQGDPSGAFLEPLTSVLDERVLLGLAAGTSIGPYELVRRLGSGGMGVVFEAVQRHPRRTVALKLLQLGLATPESARRFRYEAETLARLRHPGIAQVIEAGTHPLGGEQGSAELPWFAMEYVEGARGLLEYAEQEGLGLRARLELFRGVCAAVHHGHQRGVIHRDLKPSNVLVDREGAPKVIDFGVARRLEGDAPRVTTTGDVFGTLRYMSPEQLCGDPDAVDVRSDVYALGVILYELFTGRTPHTVDRQPLHEAARILAEETPERPSAHAASLPADLDWIALQALERDPERRYGSALALAEDIGRFLAHEPVTAGAPSTVYRLRKYARRHRVALGALGAVLLALTAGTVLANHGRARAQESARAAGLEERKAALANAFLDELLGAPEAGELGRDARVADLLDRAAQRLAGGAIEAPEVRASLQATLGRAYYSLGLRAESLPLFAAALAFERERHGPDHPRVLELSANTAVALLGLERLEEAEALAGEAFARAERVFGPGADVTCDLRGARAALEQKRDALAEAEGLLRTNLALRPPSAPGTGAWHDALRERGSLAGLLSTTGRHAEAEAEGRAAWSELASALGPDHVDALLAESKLALILRNAGRPAESLAHYEHAVQALTRAVGAEHPARLEALGRYGECLRAADRLEEAEAALSETVETLERRSRGAERFALGMRASLANVHLAQGRQMEAEEELERVLELAEPLLEPADTLLLFARGSLAQLYAMTGRGAESIPLLESVVAGAGATLGYGHQLTLACLDALCIERLRRGGHAQVVLDLEAALPAVREALPGKLPWLPALLCHQGEALIELDRLHEAREPLDEAYALCAGGPEARAREDAGRIAERLAALHAALGDEAAAEEWRGRVPKP
jgi:tetratricopeptide (TPR) repeat protein